MMSEARSGAKCSSWRTWYAGNFGSARVRLSRPWRPGQHEHLTGFSRFVEPRPHLHDPFTAKAASHAPELRPGKAHRLERRLNIHRPLLMAKKGEKDRPPLAAHILIPKHLEENGHDR